jgi:hypothetical protein
MASKNAQHAACGNLKYENERIYPATAGREPKRKNKIRISKSEANPNDFDPEYV